VSAPEERLAAAVADGMKAGGWECFFEVQIPAVGKHRADIVATKSGHLWVMETKMRLGWNAIAQAMRWRDYAHYVSVATMYGPRREDEKAAAVQALWALGLGWNCGNDHTTPPLRPAPVRVGLLLDALRPEHQASTPGSASGGYWTPTQEARRALALVVRGEPGIPLRRALQAIGVPSSASKTRRLWAYAVRRGLVPRVKAAGRGDALTLTPAEECF
jgi:hypothetical protein